MKTRFVVTVATKGDEKKSWEEKYTEDISDPEKWASDVVQEWNNSLRPHERERVLLGVSVIGSVGTYRETKSMAFLKISSLAGISLGAIHWYGQFSYNDELDEYQSLELKRILSGSDAKKLNAQHKKESPGLPHMGWEKGYKYHGFDEKDDVRKNAIEKYKELGLSCGLCEGNNRASVESRVIHIDAE